jgi:hypothetical protein
LANEAEAVQAFVEHMLKYTVRLVRNATTFPQRTSIASGLLLCRGREPTLVTAGHIFGKAGDWTIETSVVGAGKSLHLRLMDVQRPSSVCKTRVRVPDFAWATVRPDAARQMLDQATAARLELDCYRGPIEPPNPDVGYGFAAWNRVEFHEPLSTLVREASYELAMKYVRTLSSGAYEFQLSGKHRGDDYYRGASGAPIADEEGRIVALVLRGSSARNTIVGAPLAKYASILPAALP